MDSTKITKPVRVFISYRHADMQVIKDLRTNLGWLVNNTQITVFDDREILAGDNWDQVIKEELRQADIIILVVTANFMASHYCTQIELRKALDRRREHGTRIIPIIAEHCDWQTLPISDIAALPKDNENNLKPLNKWRNNKDVALAQIAAQVRQNVERLATVNSSYNPHDRDGFFCYSSEKQQHQSRQPVLKQDIRPLQGLVYTQKAVHIDRGHQIRLFKKMVKGLLQQHILLVCADPGMGKSSLLRELCKICDKTPNLSRAQLKLNSRYDPSEILHNLSLQLATFNLDEFHIEYTKYTEQRLHRRWHYDLHRQWHRRLTEKFFYNISSSCLDRTQISIIFDNYHESNTETKHWFCQSFLNYVRIYKRITLVVAGQSVPDLDIDFHGCYQLEFLHPFSSKDVLRYLTKLQLTLPHSQIISLCNSTGGRPLELALEVSKLLVRG